MKKIKIGLIGAAGFADSHLRSIAWCAEQGLCELAAVVIRDKDSNLKREEEFTARGVRIYRAYEKLYSCEKGNIDLIAIPCGIDQHAELTIRALDAGYHVMCEKPAAGSYADALAMEAAAKRSGKNCAIGYQNIFSPSIQRLKTLTLEKRFGKLLSAHTHGLWPRSSAYYGRNCWSGKISYAGKTIFDSPMQNGMAHFLENMLYVSGSMHDESANPADIYMENYHAKDIESADTQFLRVTTDTGVKIVYAATHACITTEGPLAEYRYERGIVRWNSNGIKAYETSGATDTLVEETPNGTVSINHLVFKDTIEAINAGRAPLCTIANAKQQVQCIETGFASSGGVTKVPEQFTEKTKALKEAYGNLDVSNAWHVTITGIDDAVRSAARDNKSFAEQKLPWSKQADIIRI
ncbi:MAG: Gfo/Idh/MocA family oxidoreductase [Spirochaetes bacterium]|nr:Gfo/Idh/MocA family oxidoreductase [Spirochaetota bacterium]